MADAPQNPRRGRFPLPLADTAPAKRRLVRGPYEGRAEGGAASVQSLPATPVLVPRVVPKVVPASPTPAPERAWADNGHGHAATRARMVERLRADGCRDDGVLQAMASVPRHAFVDPGLLSQAYEDTSLPIGLGQTISKPSIVARMIELLRARPGGADLNRVLEIGTGCGYQAAVLALVARQVYSVERLRGLFDKARDNLAPIRPANLRLVWGDGMLGHGPNAPYDGIISAAGGLDIPPAWLEQLAPGGRLVAPVHDTARGAQALVVIDRLVDGRLIRTEHETVRFVPLESGLDSRGT